MTVPCPRWLAGCAAVLLCPSLAGAAPSPEGPFQGLRRGDRVRMVLKSKCTFSGVVRVVSADTVTLDLRWEERGVEGTMSFRSSLVRKVEVLAAWDLAELEERRTHRIKRLREAEEDLKRVAAEREAVRQADEEARSQAAMEESKSAAPAKPGAPAGSLTAEEKEKGIALLKEFPPTEGWGTASDKTLDWLTIKFATVGAALTAAEQRFVDNYDLWMKAKAAMSASGTEASPAKGAAPAAEAPKAPATETPPATAPGTAPSSGGEPPKKAPAPPASGAPVPPPPEIPSHSR